MAGKRATGRKETLGRQSVAESGQPPAADATAPATVGVLALPVDCRIAAQLALKQEFLGALGADAIVLDGSEVAHVDTAALQLLTLFSRAVRARGGTLSWRGASAVLNEAANLLGLAETLELPAAALA